MCEKYADTEQSFTELRQRIQDGTLIVIAGGGVIRGMSTALAKQITNQNAVHISFNEPTADEGINTNIQNSGNRLLALYRLMLDAVLEKESEARLKRVDLRSSPICLFLKLQPYHLTAQERDRFFELSGHRNVFSFREPSRTLESILVAMLKITQSLHPDMDVAGLVVPGSDLSFIKADSAQKPFAQFVDHILSRRDYSMLGSGFMSYFSYYPVLNDPVLKLDAWQQAYKDKKGLADVEARAVGALNFLDLMRLYQMTPALHFNRLPDVLMAPLRFRRTGYASMAELHPFLKRREGQYVIVESTALQLEPEAILPRVFSRLGLRPRTEPSAVSYSCFDAGFLGRQDIRSSLFKRASETESIELPAPVMPLAPERFPSMFLAELAEEYSVYIQYLLNAHCLKPTVALGHLFSTRLHDGRPASDYYFVTMYALATAAVNEPESTALCRIIRKRHPNYALYFDWIDRAAQ